MCLDLNLLSPSEKKRIKLTRLYNLIKKETLFVLVVFLLLNLGFFILKQNLSLQLNQIEKALIANKEAKKSLNFRITKANQEMASFKKVQDSFEVKSNLLIDFSRQVPLGIQVKFLSLNNQSLEIQGVYLDRSDLLTFRDNLESSLLKDLEFPITNLLKQKNGSFKVFGQLK